MDTHGLRSAARPALRRRATIRQQGRLPRAQNSSTPNASTTMTPPPSTERLVIHPMIADDRPSGVLTRVTAVDAGWALLNMEVRRLARGEVWQHDTGEHEAALVMLGGRVAVASNRGEWPAMGRRRTVFDGMPYALYLPRRSTVSMTAVSDAEVAHCWVLTTEDHPARLITPSDSEIEIRGGGNATRQINSIIPPGFDCHRIVAVEVYTPGGNWSSYPPHKHDVHRVDADGRVLEADLEEFYYYKIERPAGFAVQRVYTADHALDATVVARDNDIVLVPAGYHPVSAAHGYACYYLNFLAGTAQTLANSDDPDHAWIKTAWGPRDPRVPLVTHAMER
jgi:5-deoxy-glucuronate isomerase